MTLSGMAAGSPTPPVGLLGLVLLTAFASLIYLLVSRAYFDKLRDIPGPLICRLTSLWTYYHSYIGDESTKIDELHRKYGPVIRIAPNEVIIADGTALAPVYSDKGGFMKAPCYANFDIEGHSTIFSTQDPAHRAIRSKAVIPMFSTANLRAGQATIEECVGRLVDRLKYDAMQSQKTGKPVNVLNLTRSLAVDAVSSYLFDRPFGGLDEKSSNMSANGYVDTLVAVGRFFYLPNWMFVAYELTRERFFPTKEESESSSKVDGFVEPMVRSADKVDSTYHGRLLKAGVSAHEVEVQCKDLIFAGTDSTGTNMATLCWHLAKRPDIYKRLQDEIAEADAKDGSYNPQSLRYLDAVVREGLRIAMANPTRFPRVVPGQGFQFEATNGKRYFLPPGTQVGLQPFTLHFNPEVFPEPFAFKPERWLDNPTPEMQRDWIPFGLGARQCIARNLATMELFLAIRALARENVLEGAEAVGEKIEFVEWFNSKIKGEAIELRWR